VADKQTHDAPGPARIRDNPSDQAAATDSQLLEEFVARRSEAAFATLVERHGPMVLAVCRRLLADAHDAEDAFQTTFLVLARKAGQLGRRELLANWLYGVARRVAARVRTLAARRPPQGEQAIDMVAAKSPVEEAPDLQPVLHQEVNRLPAKYRGPIVLCYLEGKTNEEAAQDLHCPVGTVKGRLARAREMLRKRLTRRGLALSTALVATSLSGGEAQAAVPHDLLTATVEAARRFAAGDRDTGPVQDLARGMLRTTAGNNRRRLVVGIALLVLVAAAIIIARFWPANDQERIQGTWRLSSVQRDGADDPNLGAFGAANWIFRGNRITIQFPGGVTAEQTFQLDPAQKPKAINITNLIPGGGELSTMNAVYELRGDTLTICIQSNRPTDRPRELATRPGDGATLMIYKRQPGPR
jgi:RNA polymerase sigma factor (sigma-70 family)